MTSSHEPASDEPCRLREIAGPAGRLDATLDSPVDARLIETPHAAVVLAHPHPLYGGTMHTKVMFHAAKALTRIGCAVLRFNFRGVGGSEGSFDDGPGEMADFRAALGALAARYPKTEMWAAGFSYGAWIAMTVGASEARVTTLIGIAPPVQKRDFTVVRDSAKPTFFIQGERDEICPLGVLRQFYAQLPEPKELVVIDGADHLFDGKVSEVGDALENLLEGFSGRSEIGT